MFVADDDAPGGADISWDYGDLLPAEAAASGHGNLDYFPAADFIESIRTGRAPELDVNGAVETAAPAIVAGMSAENGGVPFAVPDFRPGEKRPAGRAPAVVDPGAAELADSPVGLDGPIVPAP